MRRGAISFRCSRIAVLEDRRTRSPGAPWTRRCARRSGGSPRRCSRGGGAPARVGMRGSSQPSTWPSSTSWISSRLRQDHVGQVEPRELDLLRQRALEQAGLGQALVEPVVERPVVLELQRAERVRDALDGVRRCRAPSRRSGRSSTSSPVRWWCAWRMRYITGSRRLMLGEAMSIFARSTCAPSVCLPSRISRSSSRLVARRRGRGRGSRVPGSVSVPRVCAHLLGALAVDVGVAAAHQLLGELVELLEVVRGVSTRALPQSKPSHFTTSLMASTYSCSSFSGLVSSKRRWQRAAVLLREAEVQADRLGVAEMQVAVGLGREAGADACAYLPRARSASTIWRMKLLCEGPGARAGLFTPGLLILHRWARTALSGARSAFMRETLAHRGLTGCCDRPSALTDRGGIHNASVFRSPRRQSPAGLAGCATTASETAWHERRRRRPRSIEQQSGA